MSKSDMKKYIILILIGVFSYFIINNISYVFSFFSYFVDVFFPFILGGVIGFLLNVIMVKIERFLKKKIKKEKFPFRSVSILFSILFFIIVLAFVLFLLMPELIRNVELLISNIPKFFDNVEVFVLDLLEKYPDIQLEIKSVFNESGNIGSVVTKLLNYIVNGAFGFISSIISGFITFFTAIIFSIYMLSQKEYLINGVKKIIYAYFSKEKAKKIINVGELTNRTFNKFISGQCLDALILGVIVFVFCSLFGFPYSIIISVLTGVLALIPIVGAFISCLIGFILIATTSFVDGVIFVLVFLVAQQIEEHFIYPRVVGASVGLSPLWTLLAISVGGSLFGVPGMVIGLPLASVVYSLFRVNVNNRLKEKVRSLKS